MARRRRRRRGAGHPGPEAREQSCSAEASAQLLRNQGIRPEAIVTDKLASYRAAARDLGLFDRHHPGGMQADNRAENSHLPICRRERKQKFKSQGSAQRFLSTHAAVYNTFNIQPHLISRPGLRTLQGMANQAWADATRAA